MVLSQHRNSALETALLRTRSDSKPQAAQPGPAAARAQHGKCAPEKARGSWHSKASMYHKYLNHLYLCALSPRSQIVCLHAESCAPSKSPALHSDRGCSMKEVMSSENQDRAQSKTRWPTNGHAPCTHWAATTQAPPRGEVASAGCSPTNVLLAAFSGSALSWEGSASCCLGDVRSRSTL